MTVLCTMQACRYSACWHGTMARAGTEGGWENRSWLPGVITGEKEKKITVRVMLPIVYMYVSNYNQDHCWNGFLLPVV